MSRWNELTAGAEDAFVCQAQEQKKPLQIIVEKEGMFPLLKVLAVLAAITTTTQFGEASAQYNSAASPGIIVRSAVMGDAT